MLSPFRILALAGLCLGALGTFVRAADDVLPPEPTTGEWIADDLADDSLWFATSENLGFEAVAPVLRDYPRGRRWVRVIDGRPAWVMYYVPGDLLGFEIDTHHFGAQATDFHFAAGTTWNDLHPVEADYEEITGFEAKWMRLYRAANDLPPTTQFLRIDFPDGSARDAARLTEVWLRCRFDAPETGPDDINPFAAASPESLATNALAPLPPVPPDDTFVVVPYVVTAHRFIPPTAPARPDPAPVFLASAVDATPSAIGVRVPLRVTPLDVVGDLAPLPPSPSADLRPHDIFSRIASFLRRSSAW